MGRAGRVVLHATLLGALVAGAVYGILIVASYVVMVAAGASGKMPMHGFSLSQIAFGVVMVVLWGGVAVAGLRALLRQCRRSVELARWVAGIARPPSPRLAAAVAASRITGSIVEAPDGAAYAFTYGVWRPRVVVSAGLIERTTDGELVAVLNHEAHHVRNRDPLKVLALRTWAAAFFLIPLVGTLFQRILDHQELRADRAAVANCGVSSVAGALLKAVGQPAVAAGTAVAAMGGPALFEARVAQLETGGKPPLLAAVNRAVLLRSAPGIGLIAVYAVLLYQVCIAVRLCCLS